MIHGLWGRAAVVMARQAGFCDYEEHVARLTKGGDPLVTLAEMVDFEPFRYRREKALSRTNGSKADQAGFAWLGAPQLVGALLNQGMRDGLSGEIEFGRLYAGLFSGRR